MKRCATCGFESAEAAQFCGGCGRPLASTTPTAEGGERRQLTVLFCDLVGSTELAGRLDPEDFSELVGRYHQAASEVVVRLGGYVGQYLGDGVLAYFGWPQAHENGAERAARAGLELVASVGEIAPGAERLRVRVGIHTGLAIVGTAASGRSEILALGDTVNVAARVQSIAAPDAVYVTEATYRLIAGAFVAEDAGAHELKGLRAPVTVYRLLAASGGRGRLLVSPGQGLTPFVGREAELAVLRARWAHACDGHGQVVVVSAEPGMGKSRLVHQLRAAIACPAEAWIECGGSLDHENTPFFPVVELLRRVGPRNAPDGTGRVAALGSALARGGLDPAAGLSLVAPLLGLAVPDGEAAPPAAPDEQRRRLIAALGDWVLGLARTQPIAVVVEDLHWVDPSTLELLEHLVERCVDARVLLLYTARPEFRTPWGAAAHHTAIALPRLEVQHVRAIVDHLGAAHALDAELAEAVVERTDGVPLFVEELTRLVLDSKGTAAPQAIPTTLYDSLMARLDRLGGAKEVAQVGAVIGREFSHALLRAVASLPDDTLGEHVARLETAQLVQTRGRPPAVVYRFRHALIRDAAYDSVRRGRRRELHRTIAAALREQFPAIADAMPEVLARHHAEAGEIEAAVAAWQRAGERTAGRGALTEAARHYEAALGALAKLSDETIRVARELPLRIALGQALFARRGYGSPEVAAEFARARTLAAQLGDPRQALLVLVGLYVWAFNRTELGASQDLAGEILAAADRIGHAAARVWAYWAQGSTCYARGQLGAARAWLDRAVDAYAEDHHRGSPTDPGIPSLGHAALAAWHLGDADTARRRAEQALELARRLERPYSVAVVHHFTGMLRVYLRDPGGVEALAVPLERLCRDHQFPVFRATAQMYRGWALAATGRTPEGRALVHEGLARFDATGQRYTRPFFVGLLAEVEAMDGRVTEGLATAQQAIDGARDECVDRADLVRLRADLLDRAGAEPGEIERTYREAIELARAMGARADELRAAVRLGAWLLARGDAAAARDLVAPLHAAFTQGFDTRDLREAAALLERLGPRPGR